jgi:glycosyltransferase involved in cell wall biosynthesis
MLGRRRATGREGRDAVAEKNTCAVVIPTHDRPESVRQLLSSLATDAGPSLAEVIVVDDSRTSALRRDDFPALDLHIVRLEERTFMTHARNVGLARVRSEFVYVVDDDNVCDPSTLDHPLSLLASTPGIVAVMPAVVYHRRPDLVWVYATPFRPGRWGFDLIGRNQPRNPAWEDRILPTDALPNAVVFRRDALAAVEGYDERLPVGSSGDLCQRLKARGGRVHADTFARTRHDVEPPGITAFWGAHSIDPARQYHDKHDWYVFQRRLRGDDSAFAARALVHSAPFLASSLIAFALRPDAHAASLVVSMGRGVLGGLRDAGREAGSEGYKPSG